MKSIKSSKGKSSLKEIWKETFPFDVEDVLTTEEVERLEWVCFSYILNIIQWPSVFKQLSSINKKLTDELKKYDEEDSAFEAYKRLRHEIIQKYDFIVSLKLFILRLSVKEIEGMPLEFKKEMKWCDVSDNESVVWHNLESMGLKAFVVNQIKSNDDFVVPAPKDLQRDLAQFLKGEEEYIRKQVLTHLRFIYKSNNYQYLDFINKLTIYAIEAYYLKTPWLPKAHVENTARSAISNGKRKIIDYYTHESRARLYRDGDEYKNKIIKDSDIGYATKGVYSTQEKLYTDESINKVDRFLSLKFDMEKSDAVSLLMLDNDDDFIAFCKSVFNLKNISTCEEAFSVLGRNKYFGAIVAFLDIPVSAFKKLIQDLKGYFASMGYEPRCLT